MPHKNTSLILILGFFCSVCSLASISKEELEKEFRTLVQHYKNHPVEGVSPEQRAASDMYTTADIRRMSGNQDYLKYVQFLAQKKGQDLNELLEALYLGEL